MLQQKDNPNLDLLRAVAVSMVLVFHLLRYFGVSSLHHHDLKYLGMGGVLFFFVHTSLVLMFSLERLQQRHSGFELYASFLIRRVFRIYPLSILAVAIIVLFHLPLGGLTAFAFHFVPVTKLGLISNILLIQNITNTESVLGPLWSLPFEMQMYVLLPFLFIWALRSRSAWPLGFLWVFSSALGWIDIHFGHLPDIVRYIPCFLPGVIAYKIGQRTSPRISYYLWPPFLLAMVCAIVYLGTMEAGWFACLLMGLAIPQFKLLSARWLHRLSHVVAKYSYGIYLGHYFCMWLAFVKFHDRPPLSQWIVLLITLAAVPVVFYHLVEEPMINGGSRIVDILYGRKPIAPDSSTGLEAQVP
jgi:peptidoglycan/LPS O-acetylase OafA/YrhL